MHVSNAGAAQCLAPRRWRAWKGGRDDARPRRQATWARDNNSSSSSSSSMKQASRQAVVDSVNSPIAYPAAYPRINVSPAGTRDRRCQRGCRAVVHHSWRATRELAAQSGSMPSPVNFASPKSNHAIVTWCHRTRPSTPPIYPSTRGHFRHPYPRRARTSTIHGSIYSLGPSGTQSGASPKPEALGQAPAPFPKRFAFWAGRGVQGRTSRIRAPLGRRTNETNARMERLWGGGCLRNS